MCKHLDLRDYPSIQAVLGLASLTLTKSVLRYESSENSDHVHSLKLTVQIEYKKINRNIFLLPCTNNVHAYSNSTHTFEHTSRAHSNSCRKDSKIDVLKETCHYKEQARFGMLRFQQSSQLSLGILANLTPFFCRE